MERCYWCTICIEELDTIDDLREHVAEMHSYVPIPKPLMRKLEDTTTTDAYDGTSRMVDLDIAVAVTDSSSCVSVQQRLTLFPRCFVLKNCLTEDELSEINGAMSLVNWEQASDVGDEYPEDYRNNKRIISMQPELCKVLWSRISRQLVDSDLFDVKPYGFGAGGVWKPTGLNPACLFSHYQPGEFFRKHKDGMYKNELSEISIYTVGVYLSRDYKGGELVMYPDGMDPITLCMKAGSAIVFPHDVEHEGLLVTEGHKVLLRTSIMFRREESLFSKSLYVNDPEWMRARVTFSRFDALRAAGDVGEFTSAFLEVQKIQLNASGTLAAPSATKFPLVDSMVPLVSRFLTVRDICRCAAVCKGWFRAFRRSSLWKARYWEDFGDERFNRVEDPRMCDEFRHWFKYYSQTHTSFHGRFQLLCCYFTTSIQWSLLAERCLDYDDFHTNVALASENYDPWDNSFDNYVHGCGKLWFLGHELTNACIEFCLDEAEIVYSQAHLVFVQHFHLKPDYGRMMAMFGFARLSIFPAPICALFSKGKRSGTVLTVSIASRSGECQHITVISDVSVDHHRVYDPSKEILVDYVIFDADEFKDFGQLPKYCNSKSVAAARAKWSTDYECISAADVFKGALLLASSPDSDRFLRTE